VRTIAEVEKEAILNARDTFGIHSRAASAALGIARNTYYRRLKEYGVRA
jgi:transcriptional regulator of acetoin/glycerol metabolism